MKDIRWLINRLRSMNALEMGWRVQQKFLQKKEYKALYALHLPVTEISLPQALNELQPDAGRIPFNKENKNYTLFSVLDIFGKYEYEEYKDKWNAGFQTGNSWPEKDFSYSIAVGQREDIGDIRTNWELNRHYQFACLAKNYYLSGDAAYLNELKELFDDWNRHNLFLHGVEWTSAMEIGIRSVSWIYTYVFLHYAAAKYQTEVQELLEQIRCGVLVMADYIVRHRARYSSANNHLIVEMFAVGMAGLFFDYGAWTSLSVKILSEELPKQNYEDGVNKEMSLHYQSFAMEAYGILWLALQKNNIKIPDSWKSYLGSMSQYLADCCGDYGEVIAFGDNDEGKILDLQGKIQDHYRYVLQLMGTVLNFRYTDLPFVENISWLITKKQETDYRKKRLYKPELVCSYPKGGYTLIRSMDRKVLIGMDHAELGFGSIAAHGHADALSIQLYYCGKPILVDSGTYNYHVPKNTRDLFRSTKAHNTVCVEGIEQAEMLGPFLWGKRYKVENVVLEEKSGGVMIEATVSYAGICHTRKASFDFNRRLIIEDYVDGADKAYQVWHVAPGLDMQCADNRTDVLDADFNCILTMITDKQVELSDSYISHCYGNKTPAKVCLQVGKENFRCSLNIKNSAI